MRLRGWLLAGAALLATLHLVGLLFHAPILPGAEGLMWLAIAAYALLATAGSARLVRVGLVGAPIALAAWAFLTLPAPATPDPAVLATVDIGRLLASRPTGVWASLRREGAALVAYALLVAAAATAVRWRGRWTAVLAGVGGAIALAYAGLSLWSRLDGPFLAPRLQALALVVAPAAVALAAAVVAGAALASAHPSTTVPRVRSLMLVAGLAAVAGLALSVVDAVLRRYLYEPPRPANAFLAIGVRVERPDTVGPSWGAITVAVVQLIAVALVAFGLTRRRAG